MQKHAVFDSLDTWNLEAYENCLAAWWLTGGFMGHARDGSPLYFERMGNAQFPTLASQLSVDELVSLDIVHCMRSLGAIEEDALRNGRPVRETLFVCDVKGFGWDQVSISAARVFAKIVGGRNYMLTETVSVILLVRVPSWFVGVWERFKYILDEGVRNKVRMATEDQSLSLLRGFIDDENIPVFLGGSKRDVNNDPQCRTLLAPGGGAPREAIDRFRALTVHQSNVGAWKPPPTMSQTKASSWFECCTARR
jgi:hypothetical protein